MLELTIIMAALIAGYLIKQFPIDNRHINKFLDWIIVLILFLMGYISGSYSKNLINTLSACGKVVLIFSALLLIANCLSVVIFSHLSRNSRKDIISNSQKESNYIQYLISGAKYLLLVLCGISLGYALQVKLPFANQVINGILLLILFIIGYQLRQQNIPLRTIFVNKDGIIVALLITGSSIIGGLVAAYISGLSYRTGLVLVSGFGWYTLSGILTGQLLNHQLGTTAFFIDFVREIIAIFLISSVGRFNSKIAIGYCGATALDFTLPIIRNQLGEEAVPIAVTSGLLLTLLVPLFIPLFANLL